MKVASGMANKKILVVDDEPDMRIFVSTVVETEGFEPITAQNGPEALAKARSILPVLVILDVMMPKIEDGIQTYKQFRTDEKLGAIPIIILAILSAAALFGLGALVGIMLTKGVQGFALIVVGTILLIVALVNISGVIRWVKELKREMKDKEAKHE